MSAILFLSVLAGGSLVDDFGSFRDDRSSDRSNFSTRSGTMPLLSPPVRSNDGPVTTSSTSASSRDLVRPPRVNGGAAQNREKIAAGVLGSPDFPHSPTPAEAVDSPLLPRLTVFTDRYYRSDSSVGATGRTPDGDFCPIFDQKLVFVRVGATHFCSISSISHTIFPCNPPTLSLAVSLAVSRTVSHTCISCRTVCFVSSSREMRPRRCAEDVVRRRYVEDAS